MAVIRNFFGIHAFRKHKYLGAGALIFERPGMKLYHNFVANSPYIAERLREVAYGKRIKVIPNCVDETLFSLQSSEGNYILFLGRIDIYQKGLDTLLEAFKRIAGQRESRLIIGGGGKDAEKLRALVANLGLEGAVRLEGRVYGKRKEELLRDCLFVCMPSRFESFGNVAIEAAACAKPVIGTRISGLCDTIKDGDTGILVEAGQSEELSVAMLKLMDDGALRRKLGQAGREWAKSFSSEQTAKMTEEFCLECLNAQRVGEHG